MGCRCNPLRLLYLGEAPDIKQKASSDLFILPFGNIEYIWMATKKKDEKHMRDLTKC
jgi:hypothetical protein